MDFQKILWNLPGSGIEQESFRRIEAETPSELRARFSDSEWRVARRLVHTGANFEILRHLEFSPGAIEAGLAALQRGCRIYTDANMIKYGLSLPKLRKMHDGYSREGILCPVADDDVAAFAREHGITRALASVELHAQELQDAIFLCGNAPLALAGLIRLFRQRGIRPAFVVGMPVGFVNVVEAKALLDTVDFPWIRLSGRLGGSTYAVATVHGMLEGRV